MSRAGKAKPCWQIFSFYTPKSINKSSGFLMLVGGRKRKRWPEIV